MNAVPLIWMLLTRFSGRYLLKQLWRSLSLVLMVALSTSLFVAVIATGRSSTLSLEQSFSQIFGHDQFVLRARSGTFDLKQVRPSIAFWFKTELSPFLEWQTSLSKNQGAASISLTILGVDLPIFGDSSEFQAICGNGVLSFLSSDRSFEFKRAGQRLRLKCFEDRRSGIGEELIGNFVLIPIASLQRFLNLEDQLTGVRISRLTSAEQSEIRGLLTKKFPQLILVDRQDHLGSANKLTAAFNLNVRILISMAGLVCLAILFALIAASVHQRSSQYRLLLIFGLEPFVLSLLVVLETVLLAGLGVFVGITVGSTVTSFVSSLLMGTASSLYGVQGEVQFSPIDYVIACFLILLISLLASWPVGNSINKANSKVGEVSPSNIFAFSIWSSTIWIAGVSSFSCFILWLISARYSSIIAAYLSALSLFVAIFSAGASGLESISQVGFSRRSTILLLVMNSLRSGVKVGRTITASLAVAIALWVGLSLMVSSFRETLLLWSRQTFQADIYVKSLATGNFFQPSLLSPECIEALSSDSKLLEYSRFYAAGKLQNGKPVLEGASDLDVGYRRGVYKVLRGDLSSVILSAGKMVVVSEAAARKLKLDIGTSVEFSGTEVTVGAILQDFSTDQGFILMEYQDYVSQFPLTTPLSIALYAKPGVEIGSWQRSLQQQDWSDSVTITRSSELRELVMKVFDNTFEVTSVMKAIIVLLSCIGFAACLMLRWTDLVREQVLVSLMGASHLELGFARLIEAVCFALPAILYGSVGGYLLSLLLVDQINPLSFGWSFSFFWQIKDFIWPIVIVLGVVLALNLVPTWRKKGLDIEVLRYGE